MKKLFEDFLKRIMRMQGTEAKKAQEEEERREEKKQQKVEESEKKPLGAPLFVAAGKPYWFELQLKVLRIHPTEHIYKDCYGRRVLLIHERYPTFDCYDALYENRYYHYYYIETPEGFTCVRTADDQSDIPIEEGISVESFIWEKKTWHSKLLKAARLIPDEEK